MGMRNKRQMKRVCVREERVQENTMDLDIHNWFNKTKRYNQKCEKIG